MSSQSMKTPVLLLVFNRIEPTRQVFSSIRNARPARLYVAADGAREDCEQDKEKVASVRDHILGNVDWDCKVKTLFHDENLGCKYAVAKAIDWFFEHEPEGIILEDDCLANIDFFKFCEWALEAYRNDESVWQINGNNFDAPAKVFGNDLVNFTALAQAWGWATWRNRWAKYQINPFYLMQPSVVNSKKWQISFTAKINKLRHVLDLQSGLDTWDYQWQITILNHFGLCLSSKSNLISNIGDDADATHTPGDTRTHLNTAPITGDLQYVVPKQHRRLTRWYESKMGLLNVIGTTRSIVILLSRKLRKGVKGMLAAFLYHGVEPIVIASTGRSGSTVLFLAVSRGLAQEKFKINSQSRIGSVLSKCARTNIDRVKQVNETKIPVCKTHGLPSDVTSANGKFIFIYGDPLDSALSVQGMVAQHGKIWFEEHAYHLESVCSIDDLFDKDVLNFEAQVKSWTAQSSNSLLCVRYEDLWDRQDDIQRFLGFEIELPNRLERSKKPKMSNINKEMFGRLRSLID